WKIRLAELRVVHFQHHVLVDGVEAGARGCNTEFPILLLKGGFADPLHIGHAMLDRRWKSDSQVGQSERLRYSFTHELTGALSCEAFDTIRKGCQRRFNLDHFCWKGRGSKADPLRRSLIGGSARGTFPLAAP